VGFGGISKSLVDISGNFILVEFGRFPRFQFRVRAVRYKAFLLIIGGSK
jgi:hypothetical protein